MEDANSYDGGGDSRTGERPPTAPAPIAVAVPVGGDGDPGAPPPPPPRSLPQSDEEARAFAAAERERGVAAVRRHCDGHLSQNPDSSYVTWIATLHPENARVSIDPRFLVPGNPWLSAYEEARDDSRKGRERDRASDVAAMGAAAVCPSPGVPPPEDGGVGNDVASDGLSSGTKLGYSLLDSLVGGSLVMASVSSTFAFEVAAAFCYLSYWLCGKIVDLCSPPNAFALLPLCVAFGVGQLFHLIDLLLLFASTLLVESIAASNYLISTILACSHARGKALHQMTRKLPHLVRWAFRQKFEKWDPPRMTFRTNFFSGGAE